MSDLKNDNVLSSDKPCQKPGEDRLGYAPFAKHLSRSIVKMTPVDGLVTAVYAPWGSGKTTLLNFVEYYIDQEDEAVRPIIVHFNPWWFTGDENLVRHFFDQLLAVLESKSNIVAKGLIEKFTNFSEAISELPINNIIKVVTGMAGFSIDPAGVLKGVSKLLKEKQPDVAALKAEIADMLRKQDRKILVVIDDIDRLTSEEIRQLFRVIKAVADFPNVVYLLAFDKGVAIAALAQSQGISGADYLEKIIQVPFELPLPDKSSLHRMLSERLESILVGTIEPLDVSYWNEVYRDGINHFIETPRDVVRLTNSISVTYSAVAGEVNPVDFIAIETLRVFQPDVYNHVRRHPEMFAEATDGFYKAREKQLKDFHNSWVKDVDDGDKEAVKKLVGRLFPKANSVWQNRDYSGNDIAGWRKSLFVCMPDIFQTYFRLAVPEGSMSNDQIRTLLEITTNQEGFEAALRTYSEKKQPDGSTQARYALEGLEDYIEDDIEISEIERIIRALSNVGDYLIAKERNFYRWAYDLNMISVIDRLFRKLLTRIDQPARFAVVQNTIEQGTSVGTIVSMVTGFGHEQGKYGERAHKMLSEPLITVEELEETERIAVRRIKSSYECGSLLSCPVLGWVLNRWMAWGDPEEVRSAVTRLIEKDENLLLFLKMYVPEHRSRGVDGSDVSDMHPIDPDGLKSLFLDIDSLTQRVDSLNKSTDLTEEQRTTVDLYLKGARSRSEGRDPMSDFS